VRETRRVRCFSQLLNIFYRIHCEAIKKRVGVIKACEKKGVCVTKLKDCRWRRDKSETNALTNEGLCGQVFSDDNDAYCGT